MKSNAATVQEYLRGLPEDRRAVISAVRKVILRNLPKGYAQQMGYAPWCQPGDMRVLWMPAIIGFYWKCHPTARSG